MDWHDITKWCIGLVNSALYRCWHSVKTYKKVDFTDLNELFDHKLTSSISMKWLTRKRRETHGCVVSTVATDAMVLKHQAISIHSAD